MTDRLQSRFFRIASVLAVVALMALPAQAQMADEPLTSDRPGFSTAAATVSQGTFQTELGYQYAQLPDFFGDEGRSVHDVGQLLLRYGVSDAFEIRGAVGSIGLIEVAAGFDGTELDTELESGYTGGAVEAKVRLFRNDVSTISGFSSTSLPLSTGPFDSSDDRARQTFGLLFDGGLGENITLTLNGGTSFFWDSGEQEDRSFTGIFIPTLSFGINERTGAYVGYYGQYTEFNNINFVEGGFTYLVNNDLQVDLNGGLRVDDTQDLFFFGVGLSTRF